MLTPISYTNSKGAVYFLHSKLVTLRGGRTQTIYYFAKVASENALNAIPDGFAIQEGSSGLCFLKRIKTG